MYVYCLNNPIMFADPTGDFCVGGDVIVRISLEQMKMIAEALTIAMTIYGESGGRYEYKEDWEDGMLAVATVIQNRLLSDLYGNDYISVCTQANQFDGYVRGKKAYINGRCDAIMWDRALALAGSMVGGTFEIHPKMDENYFYFHSEKYGNKDRINVIKTKPETLIFAGNMFYCNY